jgi:hypothetical protein
MTLCKAQNQILDLIFSHGEELFGRNTETLILAGGTALSRGYLNHRISYDLDFFVADPFSTEALWQKLASIGLPLVGSPIVDTSGNFATQIHLTAQIGSQIVKLSVVEDLFSGMFETKEMAGGWRTEEISGLYHRKIRTISGTGKAISLTGAPVPKGGRQQARDLFDLCVLSQRIENVADFIRRINERGAGVPETQFRQGIVSIPWIDLMDDFSKIEASDEHPNSADLKRYFDQIIHQMDSNEPL